MHKKVKKILFLNFDCSKHPFFETSLELMDKCIKNGDEIYSITCDGIFDKYCCNHVRKQIFNLEWNYCKKCKRGYREGMKMMKVPPKNRFVLKPYDVPEFPQFKTIDEIKHFCIDDMNVGFGVASTVMTYTRDYEYNPEDHMFMIHKLLRNSYIILKNLEELIKKIKIDEIYLFNGRYYEFNTGVAFAKKHKIDFYIYESGADYTRYSLRKNAYIHDFGVTQKEIQETWDSESDFSKKEKIVKDWAENRRNRVEKNWRSFTKNQQEGLLPADFDPSKENIVIYNTSLDEVTIFDEYKNPIDSNDNNILREIIKKYENDNTKHFYLRVHPHLSHLNTTQIKEIREIADTNPKCMTIIPPTDEVDTYALMDACDKTLVFCSTMGVEATYWGKPVILAGVSLYDHLDCVYQVKNYDE
ncbi:MAG: hypothetical protein K6E29_00065, partial [Cyanobacteria bacterium RUI128]|nr:hypothetical protein [Cyanobacteria bacterium RUI128]